MTRRVKVPLWGNLQRNAVVDLDATEGAIFGVNLRNPDGSLVTAEQFAATGVPIEGIATTDALPEGTVNLYYTDARADARAAAAIAAHIAEADPHTQYATTTELANAIIDSIADGDATHAPSRNAVFDAMATKQAAIQFQDEGVNQGAVGAITQVDFVGAGVTATLVGTVLTVTIP